MLDAVFLDRDGVLNENREDYVKSVAELKIIPGALHAVSTLSSAGIRIVIISNQQCIGRGIICLRTLEEINLQLMAELDTAGAKIAGVYYCPHLKEDNCECRKPKPGLLLRAAEELEIDLARSVFVGDSPTDVEAGRAAGCATVLVLSGKTQPPDLHNLNNLPDYVADDLSAATLWLLDRHRQ